MGEKERRGLSLVSSIQQQRTRDRRRNIIEYTTLHYTTPSPPLFLCLFMSFRVGRLTLTVPANKAKPSPIIGQALGAHGINMMKFCKEFNEKSVKFVDNAPLRVDMFLMDDASYQLDLRLPATKYFLLAIAGKEKGNAANEIIGRVHVKQIYEIAKLKQSVQSTHPIESVFRTIVHNALALGLEVDFSKEKGETDLLVHKKHRK